VEPEQHGDLRNLVKNKLNRDKCKGKENGSRLLRPFKKEIPIFTNPNNPLQRKLGL